MTKKRVVHLSSSSETSSVDDNDAPLPPPKQQQQQQQQQQGSRGRKSTKSLGSQLLQPDGASVDKVHSMKISVTASAAAAAMPTKKDAPPPKPVAAATAPPPPAAFKNSSFRAAPPPHRKRKVPNGNSNGSCIIRPGVALLLGGSGSGSSNKNGIMASTLSLRKGPLLQTTIKSTTASTTTGTTSTTNAATSASTAPAPLRSTDNPSRKKKKQKHYLLEDDDDDDIDSSLAKKTLLKKQSKDSTDQSSSSSTGSVGSSDSEMPYTQNLGLPEQAAKLKAIRLRDDHDKKTEPLRPGDVIAYSNPIFVAGTREASRLTQVLATNPDNTDMPLELDNAECLPADLRVKRVKEYNRRDGRLYDHPGVFRPINHFRMKKKSMPTLDGTTMTGFRRQVERVQEIMASTRKEMEVIPEHLVKEAAAVSSRARRGAAGKKSSSINSPSSSGSSSDCHGNNGNASSDDHESAAPLKKPKRNIKSNNGTASSNRAGLQKPIDLHLSSSSDSELDELLKNHTCTKSQTQGKHKDKPTQSSDNRVLRTVGNSKPAEKSKATPVVPKPAAAGRTLTTPGQLGDVSTCNGDSSPSSISSIEATAMGRRTSQSVAKTTTTINAAAPLSFSKKYKSDNESDNNDDNDGDDGDGPIRRFKNPLGIIDEKTSARGGGACTFSLSKVSTSRRTRTAREKAERMSETSCLATSASSSLKERGKNVASIAKAPRNASKDERMSAFADDSESDDSLSFTKTFSSSKEGRSFQDTRTRPPLPIAATGNSKDASKEDAAKKKKRKSSFGVKDAAIRIARGLPPKSSRDDDDEFSFKVDDDDDDHHHSLDASSLSSQSISKEKKQKRTKKETKGKKNKNGAAASKVKGSNTSRQQQPQPASHFRPQRLETNNDHVYGNEMDSSSEDDDEDNNYPHHRRRPATAMRTSSSTSCFSRRTTSQMDHAHGGGGGYSSIGSSFHSSQSSVEGGQPPPVQQRKGKSCSPGMSRLARLSTAARNSSSTTKKPPVPRLRPMMLNMQSTSCLDDIR